MPEIACFPPSPNQALQVAQGEICENISRRGRICQLVLELQRSTREDNTFPDRGFGPGGTIRRAFCRQGTSLGATLPSGLDSSRVTDSPHRRMCMLLDSVGVEGWRSAPLADFGCLRPCPIADRIGHRLGLSLRPLNFGSRRGCSLLISAAPNQLALWRRHRQGNQDAVLSPH